MKRKLLSLLLVLALALSLVTPALAVDPMITPIMATFESYEGKLVVIHTNDVHGRDVAGSSSYGTAAVAQLKKDLEAAGAFVLLVSAGDAAQGTPLVNLDQGATAMDFLELAGYDLMVPGNHEFDWGVQNLLDIMEGITFPVLAANVLFAEDNTYGGTAGEPLTGAATATFEFGDFKVGVFGLNTPETATKAHPNLVSGVSFAAGEEMFAIAAAQVEALTADGCDYIIAVGHLGDDSESTGNRSNDLIENVEGIDLFIDGHSHTKLPEGEVVGDTLRVSAHEFLQTIGVVTIDLETLESTAMLYDIVDGVKAYEGIDEEIAALINARNDEVEEELLTVIGSTDYMLNGNRPDVRIGETNLGNFATDAMLWAARNLVGEDGVDIALNNGGGIRASIAAGDITMKDMVTVFPFNNTLVTLEVTGAQLLEALEAATFDTPNQVGAFPQVSGVSFYIFTGTEYAKGEEYGTYFLPADPGSRVRGVTVGGEPLDLEASYVIATNDFTAAGGDTYGTFKNIAKIETGIPMERALIDYMNEIGTIGEEYAGYQGRITVVPAGNSADAWYFDAVNLVYNEGIMRGTTNGFEYDGNVTRATVFQALYNLEGAPETNVTAPFADISGTWYEASANWAYEVGLTEGTGNGFSGDRDITRQELAKVFASYIDLLDIEVEPASLNEFVDAGLVADWAVESFESAVGAGIIGGYNGNLRPTATASRVELAQIFYSLLGEDEVEDEPIVVPEDAITGTVSDVSKYGNITVTLTGEEFATAGFEYGDILNVYTDGAVLEIPFGTNYSDADTGSLIVRDPSTDEAPNLNIIVAINMGNFAETYGVAVGDSVSFTLGEKGGYLSEYIARQLTRTNVREDYESDEVFANFRAVTYGDIAEGVLYRSASPINNEIGRAEYADALAKAAGIATIINLANSAEELEAYDADDSYATPYYDELLEKGSVIYLNMGVDFAAADFAEKLYDGLTFIIEGEGPYLLHCTEGKDRVGFTVMLLEAFMGATVEEIVEDYMLSFVNYYGVEVGSEQYNIIAEGNILGSLRTICGQEKGASLEGVDIAEGAAAYLASIGLDADQIDALRDILDGE